MAVRRQIVVLAACLSSSASNSLGAPRSESAVRTGSCSGGSRAREEQCSDASVDEDIDDDQVLLQVHTTSSASAALSDGNSLAPAAAAATAAAAAPARLEAARASERGVFSRRRRFLSGCTPAGANPWATGTGIPCCDGLRSCVESVGSSSLLQVVCWENCEASPCVVEEEETFVGHGGDCCPGLRPCAADDESAAASAEGSPRFRCRRSCGDSYAAGNVTEVQPPLPPAEEAPAQACTPSGMDPNFDEGGYAPCCQGLHKCRNTWDFDGRWYYRCYADCNADHHVCAPAGADPDFGAAPTQCCDGLNKCLAAWDNSERWYYRCYANCSESLPTASPTPASPTAAPTANRLPPAPPGPMPLDCAAEGTDPYFGPKPQQCCPGLKTCIKNWDGIGRWYYRCFADCNCAPSGFNPYASFGGRCCAGLKKCLKDWDRDNNWYYKCLPDCSAPTAAPTAAPTPAPSALPTEPQPRTLAPTPAPTSSPSAPQAPTEAPTELPTQGPVPSVPTPSPTPAPTPPYVRVCTELGSDPYQTGKLVPCCQGLKKCLGEYVATRKTFECVKECDPPRKYNPHFDTTPDYLNIGSRVKGVGSNPGKYSDNFYIVIGDQGGCGGCSSCCSMQYQVASLMKQYIEDRKKQNPNSELLFVASVGDNFYWTGVGEGSFKKAWADPYSGELIDVPWFSIMGNHDYGNSDPGAACPFTTPRFECNSSNANTPACGGSRPYSTETQEYDSNQLNANKGGLDGDLRSNYHMPDYTYYYTIPDLDFEIIAMDYNAADFNGLGGNGVGPGAGASQSAYLCGSEDKVKDFMSGLQDASTQLMLNRSQAAEHSNVAILGHYPPWFQYNVNFRTQYISNLPSTKKELANVLNFYGHTHVQACQGWDAKGQCTDFLTGGSGGCCSTRDTPAGFVVISWDENRSQTVECFTPNSKCTLQHFYASRDPDANSSSSSFQGRSPSSTTHPPSYGKIPASGGAGSAREEAAEEEADAEKEHQLSLEDDVCRHTRDHPKCDSFHIPEWLVSTPGPQCQMEVCYAQTFNMKLPCQLGKMKNTVEGVFQKYHSQWVDSADNVIISGVRHFVNASFMFPPRKEYFPG